MTVITLIAEDVRRLRAAHPDADAAQLEALLVDAALRHRAHDAEPHDILDLFIHEAAALAVYRQQLAAKKQELPDAVVKEAASYAEEIELDRDVIPPLKQEAQRLRVQMRDLEARLRVRGVDPDTIDRVANDDDESVVRGFVRRHMPLADGRLLDSRVCMYTNTPDENFVLGLDPRDARVVIASPCSGHGFKFSNIVGRICAELALDGQTDFDIGFLSPTRFLK